MNKVFIYGGGYAYDGQATLGEKQDKALPQKLDKLSKEIIPEVGITNQARLGCKGRKSSWNGWQEHIRVSRQSGLITKMATMSTSAFIQGNEPDTQGISVKKGSRFINPGFQPVRTPKTRSIG